MSCPFASMGCEVVGLQRLEMETHLRNSMHKHLEILCLKVDSNSKIIAQQQEQIEKLLSRSPLEVSPVMNGMFKTVGEALTAAEDGDRIVVHEGVYRESLVIEKRVSIHASGQVKIENASEANVIVIRNTCTLVGLTLHQRSKNFFCVRVIATDNNTVIEKCDIASDHFSCVQIDSGCNPVIRYNKIHDSRQCGILIKKNGKGRISHNDIYSNHLSNIYIDANAEPQITNNKIHNSAQHGIWVKQQGMGVFENNTICNNIMSNLKIEDGAHPIVRDNYMN